MTEQKKLRLIHACISTDGTIHANQYIDIDDGHIKAIGSMDDCKHVAGLELFDCQHQLVTPALIDCHTHLVYGADRSAELAMRLAGASYVDIARSGGGIRSTVTKTRALSSEQLFVESLPRMMAMRDEGVGTLEIKSGYGLTLKDELKMLEVGYRLGQHTRQHVALTFLGAHTLPPEFEGKQQAYVDFLCSDMIPAVVEQGYASAVDVFCEHIAFTLNQTEQVFACAQAHGLAIKCHAEQLSNLGATQLACEYQALSCDHLEFLDAQGIAAMATNKTVAVLLPGAYYFLQESKKPPVDALRQAGIPMAIATDCNPGTSPTTSLRLMMNMACILFGLTPDEAIQAVTSHAAQALGLSHSHGALQTGRRADLICWSATHPNALSYGFGYPLKHKMMLAGKWV